MTEAGPQISFDRVRRWLRDEALPLWTGAGLDRDCGGAAEALTREGADARLNKRVRSQARQVYAFSHAAVLGISDTAAASAEHVWSFLLSKARRSDGAWVRLLARDGAVLDSTLDAYDMAIVLYALAWRCRLGDADAATLAHATLDALERSLGRGPNGGFAAAEDDPARFAQNPHMHLLEAAIELAGATASQRFADLALAMTRLFRDRMFDRPNALLVERFDAAWRPVTGERQRVEPGHLLEWVWLLHRAEAVTGLNSRDDAAALFQFARERGRRRGVRLAEDALSGPELRPAGSYRLWPQTEALKAELAMFEHQGAQNHDAIAEALARIFDLYLARAVPGAWTDQLDGELKPAPKPVASSGLYHLLLAFSELLRLQPALEGVLDQSGLHPRGRVHP